MRWILYICVMYFFRKKDPDRPTSIDIKIMHVINALAISIFIIGITLKLLHWI
ncbi:DUF6728 family protein [Pedobacter cryoconitis]|uniref:DUF6728 family protein n=1 Tax=Pedobacter cryoconitis TaxID=188932 RepID=UPI002950033F|nr:DUF6728 family protein [Pedobacter cryoconitis]